MQMVAHQTVGQNLDPVFVTIFFEPVQKNQPIFVGGKISSRQPVSPWGP
jgi:hypothetical protein